MPEMAAILNFKWLTVFLSKFFYRIGRSSGYRTSELETLADGQMLVIGGKEIEVDTICGYHISHVVIHTRSINYCSLI